METTDVAKSLNDVARQRMIERLLRDILFDLNVCKLEGWPADEYISMLHHEIDNLYNKLKSKDEEAQKMDTSRG